MVGSSTWRGIIALISRVVHAALVVNFREVTEIIGVIDNSIARQLACSVAGDGRKARGRSMLQAASVDIIYIGSLIGTNLRPIAIVKTAGGARCPSDRRENRDALPLSSPRDVEETVDGTPCPVPRHINPRRNSIDLVSWIPPRSPR